MINLATPVQLPQHLPAISHRQKLLLMGSCFTENIGNLLVQNGFACDINPLGIVYNPLSICKGLDQIIFTKEYTPSDLFFYRGCWHSAMHHGSFSSASQEAILQQINTRIRSAATNLQDTDWLIMTWGTSYVYRAAASGEIVSNCHKLPERNFIRELLSVDLIVQEVSRVFDLLFQQQKNIRVLLTVSPIRHIRDGLHANQISKSILLLSIEQLCEKYGSKVFYFPSYEIILDELRDYRFYADDLVHPSNLAVNYLWEKFESCFINPEERNISLQFKSICAALQHRPLHPDSDEYKNFKLETERKKSILCTKYPNLVQCFEKMNLTE